MDHTTHRILDDTAAKGTEEHNCKCRQEKYRRQSSSHKSPRIFDEVSNPPPMSSDSSEDSQETDIQAGLGATPASLESRLEDAKKQIHQLQQEKRDAIKQVKEITKMNSRWQKYDKEREVVVVNLTTKVEQLEDKIPRLETKLSEQRNRSEELELRWTDARVRAAERKSEVERTQREYDAVQVTLKQSEKKCQDLSKRLETVLKQGCKLEQAEAERRGKKEGDKERDLYHMSKRVVDLKEKLARLENQVANHKTEMDQQADLYRQQISICLDDFKHEKKDRQQYQKENADLKKQLKKAEDFASSLKVQITRYQENQRVKPARYIKPSTHHVHKYYANMYDENLDSWDDAGYALPSDVVRDEAIGFDETDHGVRLPLDRLPQMTDLVDPPPKYDDRSIMGHVITSPPKTYQSGRVSTAQTKRVEELVLH